MVCVRFTQSVESEAPAAFAAGASLWRMPKTPWVPGPNEAAPAEYRSKAKAGKEPGAPP